MSLQLQCRFWFQSQFSGFMSPWETTSTPQKHIPFFPYSTFCNCLWEWLVWSWCCWLLRKPLSSVLIISKNQRKKHSKRWMLILVWKKAKSSFKMASFHGTLKTPRNMMKKNIRKFFRSVNWRPIFLFYLEETKLKSVKEEWIFPVVRNKECL